MLWVRSIDQVDWIGHVDTSGQGYGIGLANGRIIFRSYRYLNEWTQFIGWRTHPQVSNALRLDFTPPLSMWDRFRVWWMVPTRFTENRGAHSTGYMTVIPCWIACMATAVLPMGVILIRIRRRHPDSKGRCPSCNYDLTGNTSGVCPECGTPVPQSSATRSDVLGRLA